MTSSNQHQDYIGSLSCNSLTVREPIKIAQGVSEWKSYTPTLSTGVLGTGGVSSFRYRLVGQTLELNVSHNQSVAGTAGSGTYTISLPTGCIADTSSGHLGSGVIFASKTLMVAVYRSLTSAVTLFLSDPTNTTPVLLPWVASNTDYNLAVSALTVSFVASIPLNPTSAILRQ